MIDKNDFYLFEIIKLSTLKKRIKHFRYRYEILSQNGSKFYVLRVWNELNQFIDFEMFNSYSKYVRKVLSNPSHFNSFYQYTSFIINLIGANQFQAATIYRLDFAVDINLSFEKSFTGLRVARKSYSRSYESKAGRITGIEIGRWPEQISVYDKHEKDKSYPPDTTRIEVRTTSNKKPIDRLVDFPNLHTAIAQSKFDPFNKIHIYDLNFADIRDLQSRRDIKRVGELEVLCRACSYQNAIKFLNKDNNFHRNYKNVFTATEIPLDLSNKFKESIQTFFLFEGSDEIIDYESGEIGGEECHI